LTFAVNVRNTAATFISTVPEKSRRLITIALSGLEDNPFPGTGGDKERIVLRGGKELFRLHISHSFTAFYSIDKENRIVRVHEVLSIEQAHKKYGRS